MMEMRIVIVIALAACGSQLAIREPEPDPCALPQGTTDLDPQVGNIVLRRSLACTDHRYGRISDDDYRHRVARLDAELAGKSIKKRPAIAPELPTRLIEWATSVVEYSTQYSENSWSAQQVLGPPDVFPAYGDLNKAWASKGADDRDEFIEVGFAHAEPISGVEIYETFNPGAIDKLELVTVKGRRIDVPVTTTHSPGVASRSELDLRCTREPIASVRVHLDSVAVAGWNEIDAIGVVPCTR